MQISRIEGGRAGNKNYAWMLRPNDATWNTHFACCWFSENETAQRDDLERLAGRMDSFVIEFSAHEVAEAARKEGFKAWAPLGAQTMKRFAITLFDL
ncbi:hypothetical protein [Salipiger mucosus]|uniref:Uncharacterized protein n=1 Tax=Salipiger mucosus DSM 16094 TaxID=1123237 RepID=S9S3L6_9RHOB|nr:hypothetical protein [Salipiger mucosus]EPX84790.1 hypothetical protein Salmuc_01363 [Salipiger mucosus DSM 16094]